MNIKERAFHNCEAKFEGLEKKFREGGFEIYDYSELDDEDRQQYNLHDNGEILIMKDDRDWITYKSIDDFFGDFLKGEPIFFGTGVLSKRNSLASALVPLMFLTMMLGKKPE